MSPISTQSSPINWMQSDFLHIPKNQLCQTLPSQRTQTIVDNQTILFLMYQTTIPPKLAHDLVGSWISNRDDLFRSEMFYLVREKISGIIAFPIANWKRRQNVTQTLPPMNQWQWIAKRCIVTAVFQCAFLRTNTHELFENNGKSSKPNSHGAETNCVLTKKKKYSSKFCWTCFPNGLSLLDF